MSAQVSSRNLRTAASSSLEIRLCRSSCAEIRVSRPPVLPLACDRHGWDSSPWAFPQAPHPTDQEPAAHAAVGTGRTPTRSYVLDISRTSSTSSLTTCDLVSQPPRTPPSDRPPPPRSI